MANKVIGKILDPERASVLLAALGTDEVPLVSDVPQLINFIGDGKEMAYFLDHEALTDEEMDNLARAVSARWNIPLAEVLLDIAERGAPILAKDVLVRVVEMEA